MLSRTQEIHPTPPPKWHGEYFGLLDMVGLWEASFSWLFLASLQIRSGHGNENSSSLMQFVKLEPLFPKANHKT